MPSAPNNETGEVRFSLDGKNVIWVYDLTKNVVSEEV